MDIQNSPLVDVEDLLPGFVYRCKVDAKWTMLYLSSKFTSILHYSLDEINKKGYFSLLNESERDEVLSSISRALDDFVEFKIHYSVRSAKGELVYLEQVGKGVYEDGVATALEGFVQVLHHPEAKPLNAPDDRLHSNPSQGSIADDACAHAEFLLAKDRYRLLAENSVDCIWQMDRRLHFTYLSPSLYALTGFRPEEWVGTSVSKYTNWTSFSKLARRALGQFQNDINGFERCECLFVHKNGEERPFELTIRSLTDDEGRLIGFQGASRDIRHRVSDRNQLRLITQRLNIANEAVKNGIWDWDLSSNNLIWDDIMFEIYGLDKNNFTNNYVNWQGAVHPDDLKREEQLLNQVIQEKGIYDSQFRINHPTKGLRNIRVFAKYVELDSPHLIGVNYDNTIRMKNKQQLAQSEQQFRNLFEQNNDIIIVLSPDGIVQKMNNKGIDILGFDPLKVEKSLTDLDINPESKSKSEEFIEALNHRVEVPRFTKQYMVKFNHKRDFEVSLSPIYDESQDLIEIVAILRDITQRLEYESEIIKQRTRALESDRLKTAFLMNMSHEIRTPLNAVMGFTQLLSSTSLSDKQDDYLNYIKQGGKRLENAVTDILEASALQKNQFVVSLRKSDVNVILKEVYNKAKHQYASKLDKINFSIHNTCDADLRIETDGPYLRKVLMRIIDNSFKFTTLGEVALTCKVSQSQINISVKDSGCGIHSEKLKVLFQFFRQGEESLTRGYEGLGLGLPISKGILNKLGYAMNIYSTPNVGTEVVITIPRMAILSTTNVEPLKKKKRIDKDQYSILVVEDNIPSGLLLTKLLNDKTEHLDVAKDGAACKYFLKKKEYDIAFVDLKLPDYSGYDLIPLIKKANPNCKICVQSAFADQVDINKAIRLGAHDYITKPVSKAKIISFFAKISKHRP